MRLFLITTVLVGGIATAASAYDISAGTCAGVSDVSVTPSGGVSLGGAWVNPAGCVGPK